MTLKEIKALKKKLEWEIGRNGLVVQTIDTHIETNEKGSFSIIEIQFKYALNVDDEFSKYLNERYELDKNKVKLIIK